MLMAATISAALFAFPIPPDNQDIAMVMLGIVLGWAGNVVQFHFGSSEGSKEKTALMADDDALNLDGFEK
jgi:hypothetical protein